MENILFYIVSILIVMGALGIVLFKKHLFIVLSFLICVLSVSFLFLFLKNSILFLFIYIPLPAIIAGLLLAGIGEREKLVFNWKRDWPRTFIAIFIAILVLIGLVFVINNSKWETTKVDEFQSTSPAKIAEILYVEHAILLIIIFVYFISFFVGIYFVSKDRK